MSTQEHQQVLRHCCGPVNGPLEARPAPSSDSISIPKQEDPALVQEFKKERSHKGL